MQVKYKLQAVVINCDIICTLNFSLLICCGICYNGSQSHDSQQYDSMCNLFAIKCVDMKHEQDYVLWLWSVILGRCVALMYWIIYFLTIYNDFCKKCVIKLDWVVIALNDKGTVSNSCYFVIAVLFDEFILMWLWSPSWPQEGNHMFLFVTTSQGCAPTRSYPPPTPPKREKKPSKILHIILMCH